jgi:hypothetical protein
LPSALEQQQQQQEAARVAARRKELQLNMWLEWCNSQDNSTVQPAVIQPPVKP